MLHPTEHPTSFRPRQNGCSEDGIKNFPIKLLLKSFAFFHRFAARSHTVKKEAKAEENGQKKKWHFLGQRKTQTGGPKGMLLAAPGLLNPTPTTKVWTTTKKLLFLVLWKISISFPFLAVLLSFLLTAYSDSCPLLISHSFLSAFLPSVFHSSCFFHCYFYCFSLSSITWCFK